MMRRGPVLTSVAIFSLALGIAANTAIFRLIDAVMLKYLLVSHPEELLQVTINKQQSVFSNPIWVIGLGAALAATRLVSTFLYGLKPTDSMTFALSAGILLGVALVAGYRPARRASLIDRCRRCEKNDRDPHNECSRGAPGKLGCTAKLHDRRTKFPVLTACLATTRIGRLGH
jgi:hypothetical protein